MRRLPAVLSPLALGLMLPLLACDTGRKGGAAPAGPPPGGETVNAGTPRAEPGHPVAARFWTEVDPISGKMESFELHAGNVIYRDPEVAAAQSALRYDHTGTPPWQGTGCTMYQECIPPAGMVRARTDQRTVTFMDANGNCYSNGGLCDGSATRAPRPTEPPCSEPNTFCGDLDIVSKMPTPLPNLIWRMGQPGDTSCGPVSASVNAGSDPVPAIPILGCQPNSTRRDFGLCAYSGFAKLDDPANSSLNSCIQGDGVETHPCSYCYGNAGVIDTAHAGLAGLKHATMPNQSDTVIDTTMRSINTIRIAIKLTGRTRFSFPAELRYSSPGFETSAPFWVIGGGTGGCAIPGESVIALHGGGFGPPAACHGPQPLASCPEEDTTSTAPPPGSHVTLGTRQLSTGYRRWSDRRVDVLVPYDMAAGAHAPRLTSPLGTAVSTPTVNVCAAGPTPAAPSSLAAVLAGPTQVNLTWNDNAGNERGYRVFRSTTGTFEMIAQLPANTRTYSDVAAVAPLTNSYRVVAYHIAVQSAPSNTVAVPVRSPDAATAVRATVTASGTVTLNWTNNGSFRNGNRIMRSSDGVAFSAIASVSASATSHPATSQPTGTVFHYRIDAFNAAGDTPSALVVSRATTAQPPSGLGHTRVNATTMDLTWTDAVNETTYRIERSSNNGGSWTSLTSTLAQNAVTYRATGLNGTTNYWFRIRSQNAVGNSSYVELRDVRTVLPAPSNVFAAALASTRVRVTWTDTSQNEAGFTVERGPTATGPWQPPFMVFANSGSYNDTGLAPATTYFYRVASYNAGGPPSYAAPVSVTTPAQCVGEPAGFDCSDGDACTTSDTCDGAGVCRGGPLSAACSPPPAPTGLTATARTASTITLAWTDASSNELGFHVERGPADTGPWTRLAGSPADAVSYQDGGLTPATTFFYRVGAHNDRGASYTTPVQATTFPACAPGASCQYQATSEIVVTPQPVYAGIYVAAAGWRTFQLDQSHEEFLRLYQDVYWDSGNRLVSMTAHTVDGLTKYSGVWGESTAPQFLGLDRPRQHFLDDRTLHPGFMPISITMVTINGEARYSGVWNETSAPYEMEVGIPRGQFVMRNAFLHASGMRLIAMASTTVAGEPLFTGVWQTAPGQQTLLTNLDINAFNTAVPPVGEQLLALSTHVINGTVFYNALWGETNRVQALQMDQGRAAFEAISFEHHRNDERLSFMLVTHVEGLRLDRLTSQVTAGLAADYVGASISVRGMHEWEELDEVTGFFRTDADPPRREASPTMRADTASVTKLYTAAAVMQRLHELGQTGQSALAADFLPDDFEIGPGVDTLTFYELLTHRAGFAEAGNPFDNLDYNALKEMVRVGIDPARRGNIFYKNANFSIFRVILPIMNGFPKSGVPVPDRPRALSDAYLDYMNDRVFRPSGIITRVEARPDAVEPVLYYGFPAGTMTPGHQYGDDWDHVGGRGLYMSTRDTVAFLAAMRDDVFMSVVPRVHMLAYAYGWDTAPTAVRHGSLRHKTGGYSDDTGPMPGPQKGLRSTAIMFDCGVQVAVQTNSQIRNRDLWEHVRDAYQSSWVPIN